MMGGFESLGIFDLGLGVTLVWILILIVWHIYMAHDRAMLERKRAKRKRGKDD